MSYVATGLDNRNTLIGVDGRNIYRIPAPDTAMPMPVVSYGSSSKLLSGANDINQSEFGSKNITMDWDKVSGERADTLLDVFYAHANKKYYWLDPFSNSRNILPAMLAQPYLLAAAYTPFKFDKNTGRELAFTATVPTNFNRPDKQLLLYKSDVSYTWKIPVPARCSVRVVAGISDPSCLSGGISAADTAFTPAVDGLTASDASVLDVNVGQEDSWLHVKLDADTITTPVMFHYCQSLVWRTGHEPTPDMRTFKTGMGADAFSVVPGSFNLAGLSAPNREYNVSIQLQEVYPWL